MTNVAAKNNPRTNVRAKGKALVSRSNDERSSVPEDSDEECSAPKSKKKKRNFNSNYYLETKNKNMNDKVLSLCASGSDVDRDIIALGESSTENEDSLEDLLALGHGLFDKEEEGPPVKEELTNIAKKLRKNPLSKDKIVEKAKAHPKPENCNIETKNVNPEVWKNIMTTQERSLDLKLQKP